jgi:hypothetical protein
MVEGKEMRRAACTIVSANYLPYARTLCESFKKQHSDYEIFVLLVDRLPPSVDVSAENFTLVSVEDLGIPDFESIAFQYDILELNTNVKATFLRSLLQRGVEQLIYFDPDIYVMAGVDFIYELLETYNIVITPHSVSPLVDKDRGLEQDLLSHGLFNLGFIAVANSSETHRFLRWWADRCLQLGFADLRDGLFVDQKWANFTPIWFDGVHILKHLGCNMAHWNLHERYLTPLGASFRVNNSVPLVFYHCSGVKAEDTGLVSSKGKSSVTIDERQDLRDLLASYRSRLVANGIRECQHYKYAFGEFSNGSSISSLARRVYSFKKTEFPKDDPFSSDSRFYSFAKRNHLLGSGDHSGKFNALNYDRSDFRIRLINRVLRGLLAVLGSDRYTMLMKYLSFVSILRNQKELF